MRREDKTREERRGEERSLLGNIAEKREVVERSVVGKGRDDSFTKV